MVAEYEAMYGQKPAVEAIHAGLECGLFYEKLSGLDCVSFGPNMKAIHTTEGSGFQFPPWRERISTCAAFWSSFRNGRHKKLPVSISKKVSEKQS